MGGVAESRNESAKAPCCCICPQNPPVLGDFEVIWFPTELAKVVEVLNFAFISTRFQRLNAMIYVGRLDSGVRKPPTGLAEMGV
jgi:hypothetical protein